MLTFSELTPDPWKPLPVALKGFIQILCGHSVEFRQISVQHDLVPANQMNPALNGCERNGLGVFWHKCLCQTWAIAVNETMLAARCDWALKNGRGGGI